MVRVLTAGHVNWDVTLRVESLPDPDGEARITSQRRSGGGSAANVASALVMYGAETGIIGSVGGDEPGFLASRELEIDGVDVTGLKTIRQAETTIKYLIVDASGQVMVLGNDGANEYIYPEDVDESLVRNVDHLHLTSQRPETAVHLADVAHEAGVTVSFDPGRRLADRDYGDLPERVDVLFLNDLEATAALGEETPEAAVAATDRVIVVKHGEEGATAYTDVETFEHDGFGITPVDTTGAGDAFAAGFLAVLTGAWDGGDASPSLDADLDRALAIANACGALAAREEGAKTAPDRDAALAFLGERGYPVE